MPIGIALVRWPLDIYGGQATVTLMYVTLIPDDFVGETGDFAREAVGIIAGLAGCGDLNELDTNVDVVDGAKAATTALVALVDLLYDPPTGAAPELAHFLERVAAALRSELQTDQRR